MDWTMALKQVVSYMEEHLLEEITYDEIAAQIYVSTFHFHRTFALMTGMSASTYIRNRRLTLAAHDLAEKKQKVIDVALKYGYESPESFTKAFRKFHGIAPSQARTPKAALQACQKLIIPMHTAKKMTLNYRIEQTDEMTLMVKQRKFHNEITLEEGNHDIADFWTECDQDGSIDVLKKHQETPYLYGVCAPLGKIDPQFLYGIGVICQQNKHMEGFDRITVVPQQWAVFRCIGEDGGCIGEMWERIFKEFLVQSEYEMLDEMDFELYPPAGSDYFCEIWIPVRKREDRQN